MASAPQSLDGSQPFAGVHKKYYRVREFAYVHGFKENFVWRLIRQNKVRSFKVGGVRLIPVSEGQRLIEEAV